jgi:hypothetical protein
MTTNQDRAAQLLYNEGCGSGDTAHYIARRLADAGLITPTHPVRLVTEEDYHNAPKRTVVWGRGESSRMDSALEKYGDIWFESGDDFPATSLDMECNGPHEVLRWGDVS